MKKIVFGLVIFLSFCTVYTYASDFGDIAYTSTSEKNVLCSSSASPGVVIQTPPGNIDWGALQNTQSADGAEASLDVHSNTRIKDAAARLILSDGSIGLEDKSDKNDWTEASRYVSYGGDTWGVKLSPQDVNDPRFGFMFRIGGGIMNSNFLKATKFDFHIPPESTISSVTVEVKRREAGSVGYVDHIKMTVCYSMPGAQKELTLPLIFSIAGTVPTIRIAPGDELVLPVSLQGAGVEGMPDVTVLYQIRRGDELLITETDSVTGTGGLRREKKINLPKNFAQGIYTASGSVLYSGKTIADVLKLQFVVENKFAGFFVSQLLSTVNILLLFVVILVLFNKFFVLKSRKVIPYDYTSIPESERVYYEMISDMIIQIHDSIGDKAYKMANAIPGLSVDSESGKIMRIAKDPSEVMSVLFIKYQTVFKKKLNIKARSTNKKVEDKALAVEKNLDEFEKYFGKKVKSQ